MASKNFPKGPWDEKWNIFEKIGGGGQGNTYLVNPKHDDSLGVLKILNNQKDPERRRRMYRESTNLRTLRHDRIPGFLDTNAHDYDSDARLYLVTEYVEGETLEDAVTTRKLTLDEAFELTKALCDALEYAHERGIVHRDIKPDNIVLRGSSVSDPVLIDFGLSFNAADSEEKLTAKSQHLGNRFLELPELKHGPLKRDPRSDLTQVVGIVFFAITGEEPTTLLNHEGRLPHQRPEPRQVLDNIRSADLTILNRVFDIGFQTHIDRRWQSVQALRSALEPGEERAEEAPVDVSNLKDELSAALVARDPKYSDRVMLDKLHEALMHAVYGPVSRLLRELDGFQPVKIVHGPDYETMSVRYGAGLRPKHARDVVFSATFTAKVTGNEIAILREDGDREIEVLRVPLSSDPDLSPLRAQLETFYREGILRQTTSS